LSGLDGNPSLEELWLNMNHISDPTTTLQHLLPLTKLKTIYLADNPVVKGLNEASGGQGYHLYLKQKFPSLEQIDGYMVQ
jgi:Leucine-rich repeat (LRR) protein